MLIQETIFFWQIRLCEFITSANSYVVLRNSKAGSTIGVESLKPVSDDAPFNQSGRSKQILWDQQQQVPAKNKPIVPVAILLFLL